MKSIALAIAATLPCAVFTTAAVVLELHAHHWGAAFFGVLILFVIPTLRFSTSNEGDE